MEVVAYNLSSINSIFVIIAISRRGGDLRLFVFCSFASYVFVLVVSHSFILYCIYFRSMFVFILIFSANDLLPVDQTW